MPSHKHTGTASNGGAHTHPVVLGYDVCSGSGYGKYMPKENSYNGTRTVTSNSAGNHTHTLTINNTGGGSGHNNIPPFVVAYIWQRVS